jgi:AcrR family transcriptional regulator
MKPSPETALTGDKTRPTPRHERRTPVSGVAPAESLDDPTRPTSRVRLMAGMIRAVTRHGYTEATIAHAIADAHVSRSTFYEHFTDKEDCFLAAYEDLASRMKMQLRETVERAPWPAKANAMLSSVLDPEELATPRWRLLLSLARGGGPRVRLAREQLVAELEQLIDGLLSGAPPGTLTLDIPPKALLGGVRSVISIRRYQGDLDGGMREQLMSWTRSYAVPAEYGRHSSEEWNKLGEALGAAPRPRPPVEPRRLPRGRSRLPADVVSGEHHDRIMRATVAVIRHKSYAATTIADIVAAGGVSRNVFYKLFHTKEEAFIAAQRLGLQEGVTACSRAFFDAYSWPERVWRGVRALLECMSAGPDLAYVVVVEPNAVGNRALQRVIDMLKAFTIFLEEGYRQSPQAEQLPRVCSDAIAGALFEILYHHATHDLIDRLPELTPQFSYVALAPFVGPAQASELVHAMAPRGDDLALGSG